MALAIARPADLLRVSVDVRRACAVELVPHDVVAEIELVADVDAREIEPAILSRLDLRIDEFGRGRRGIDGGRETNVPEADDRKTTDREMREPDVHSTTSKLMTGRSTTIGHSSLRCNQLQYQK